MGVLFKSMAAIEPDYMRKKEEAEKKAGRKLTNKEFEDNYLEVGGGVALERYRHEHL